MVHGSKETIVKCLNKHDGIAVLKRFFLQQCCDSNEKILFFTIINKIVEKVNDVKLSKLMIPIASRFIVMLDTEDNCSTVYKLGIELIYLMSTCQGSEPLMREIFKNGVSSYAVNALWSLNPVHLHQEEGLSVLTTWKQLCQTISFVLVKRLAHFDQDYVKSVCIGLQRKIRKCVIDLEVNKTAKLDTVDAAVLVMQRLLFQWKKEEDLAKIEKFGIVKDIVNVLDILLNDTPSNSVYHELIYNCYLVINYIVSDVEPWPNVQVIAPILKPIRESIMQENALPGFSKHAKFVAGICYEAVKQGRNDDVKYLVNNGLIPLMVKLQEYLTSQKAQTDFVNALYGVIVKAPDSVDFCHFPKDMFDTLFLRLSDAQAFIDKGGKVHKEKKAIFLYVTVAIGISHSCTDDPRFKTLNDHFHQHFKDIESDVDQVLFQKKFPRTFLMKKMAKVNCLKSSVLPHIWYLANDGCESIEELEELFESLPDARVAATQEEIIEQVLKHVLVEVKTVLDRKSDYTRADLIKLTEFLTTIHCSDQGDVILYCLEDLVSPCFGVIEDQDDEVIINNVKKFINNLHYG